VCPSLSEVKDAIGMLCEERSPGTDGLHPEIIRRGRNRLAEVLHDMITKPGTNQKSHRIGKTPC